MQCVDFAFYMQCSSGSAVVCICNQAKRSACHQGNAEVTMTFWKDYRCWTLFCATGAGQKSKKKGAGTKMLDDLKKKGKPVTPKLEEMALWLDSLDTSTLDDGQVSQNTIVCKVFCDACQHCHQFSQS